MTDTPTTEAGRPTTTNGLALVSALRKPRTMPDPEVDWSAWVLAIEVEARGELDAFVAEVDAAIAEWKRPILGATSHRGTDLAAEAQSTTAVVRINAARAALTRQEVPRG